MLIEDFLGGGGRSPKPSRKSSRKPTTRFSQAVRGGVSPTPPPLPRTSRSRARFEPDDLVELTPFTMPVEDPEDEIRLASAIDPTRHWARGLSGVQASTESTQRNWARGPTAFPSDTLEAPEGRELPVQEAEQRAPKPKVRRAVELSWDDYQALSEDQRAAVDFNTLLVQAREKDLNADYDPSKRQEEHYEQAVEHMFGEGKGSETFAPETVALLRQIDFKATNEDLDDFLGLKATISANELEGFEAKPIEASVQYEDGTVDAKNSFVGEAQLARNTSKMQEAMAQANTVLQTFQATATAARNDEVQFFGGTANKVAPALGYGTDADRPKDQEGIDAWFQNAFTALSLKENEADLDQIWGTINQTLNPGELKAFVRYVDERTSRQDQFDLDLGPGKDKQYRSPEEYRQLLNLDGRAE